MTASQFQPIVYLKQNCPFCMKVRLFLLEGRLNDQVETRDFTQGSPEEEAIRNELLPHLKKLSFPAAQLEPGRFMAESEDIIAFLAQKSGRNPASMTVYRNYVDGPFAMAMKLWKENQELRQAASAS
ncbi:glutathione S-transferase N-terminal domain-containing protein [Bradyrhizobium sp. KB893862 SZCCT0404]|uniref:glutathione S-transferase N-terminal domain-containing protein n=1 Tax=Bradyrhizobium sp. KB893862 SZCCT0404 TaxID=2807672 RepID=UPI001BAA1CEC|nr:glutathione S-transferase N-terminal domain-containing protein [Bradyrhizobium sp. KB893862 SZCCT0404]MBR1175316.1 glutathione S-transferase N-terminal domain-containing protein [Bradyrhizobium sp. KB893862 SZCCT0404]